MSAVGSAVNSVRGHGRHVVGFYDHDDELVPAIAAFLAGTLEADDGVAVVVATDEHRRALEASLSLRGHSIAALRRSGRFRSFDAVEMLTTFMVDDTPDRRRFDATAATVLELATQGGGPVAFFGEMVALLWDSGNVDGAIEVETWWNDLAARYEFALFCAYTMSSLEAAGDLGAAKRVCDAHSELIPLDADDADARVSYQEQVSYQDDMSYATRSTRGAERLFVATPFVLRSVRRFVRGALDDAADDRLISDAELVATELATNAVMHARSPFVLSVVCTRSKVRVSVRDTSFVVPEHVEPHADRVGGRGVGLVAAFSQAWGSEIEADGKTVWAEIAR